MRKRLGRGEVGHVAQKHCLLVFAAIQFSKCTAAATAQNKPYHSRPFAFRMAPGPPFTFRMAPIRSRAHSVSLLLEASPECPVHCFSVGHLQLLCNQLPQADMSALSADSHVSLLCFEARTENRL
jgi:hypothetical protein